MLDIVDRNGNWWQARKPDGTVGIIPSNYVSSFFALLCQDINFLLLVWSISIKKKGTNKHLKITQCILPFSFLPTCIISINLHSFCIRNHLISCLINVSIFLFSLSFSF